MTTEDQRTPSSVRPQDPSTFSNRLLRCHGCNRLGHVRKNCRIRCYNCGQSGHVKSECAKFVSSAVPLNSCGGTASVSEAVPIRREESVPQQRVQMSLH